MPLARSFFCLAAAAFMPMQALAEHVTFRGKIKQVDGHSALTCAMVLLKENGTNTNRWFRIPSSNAKDIFSVAMTGLSTGLDVSITYDTAEPAGCGSEPKIAYITIYSAN